MFSSTTMVETTYIITKNKWFTGQHTQKKNSTESFEFLNNKLPSSYLTSTYKEVTLV